MSTVCNDLNVSSIGASGAIFGVTAAFLGVLITNWQGLGQSQYVKYRSMMVCMIILILFFNFSMMMGTKNSTAKSSAPVDNYAHLGGFLTGVFYSMYCCKALRTDENFESNCRNIGKFGTIGLVVGLAIAMLMGK